MSIDILNYNSNTEFENKFISFNNYDLNEFYNKFEKLNDVWNDDIIEYEESKIFLKNFIDIFYYFHNNNPIIILMNSLNPEIKKKIDFLNENLIKFKYYIKKFNLYDDFNDEIKIFYDDIFKFYIKINNIIELNNFDANLLIKIDNNYYYNDKLLKENQIFMYFELKNDFYYYYISNNKIVHNKSIDKYNCAFFNFINMNIDIDKKKFRFFEIVKYYDKIIELKQRIKEIKRLK